MLSIVTLNSSTDCGALIAMFPIINVLYECFYFNFLFAIQLLGIYQDLQSYCFLWTISLRILILHLRFLEVHQNHSLMRKYCYHLQICKVNTLSRSLRNILNNIGPNTEPCDTPDNKVWTKLKASWVFTFCFQRLRYKYIKVAVFKLNDNSIPSKAVCTSCFYSQIPTMNK